MRQQDIYDFAGWLTTRPGVMPVGSSSNAAPMAEAVKEYIETYPERFDAEGENEFNPDWDLANDMSDALDLLERCETEMRYAGWKDLVTDNVARQQVYRDVEAFVSKEVKP